MQDTKPLFLRIPEHMWVSLKHEAVNQRRPVNQIAVECLGKFISRIEKRNEKSVDSK